MPESSIPTLKGPAVVPASSRSIVPLPSRSSTGIPPNGASIASYLGLEVIMFRSFEGQAADHVWQQVVEAFRAGERCTRAAW